MRLAVLMYFMALMLIICEVSGKHKCHIRSYRRTVGGVCQGVRSIAR